MEMILKIKLSFTAILFTISICFGINEELIQDISAGFDDKMDSLTMDKSETIQKEYELESIFKFNGSIGTRLAFNLSYDQKEFTMLKTYLRLNLKTDFDNKNYLFISGQGFYDAIYNLNGHKKYTQEYLDRYEQELKINEIYLNMNVIPFLKIIIGRQIVVWGFSELFQVVDCINPLDLREPGMADISDMRLPLFMTRTILELNRFSIEANLIHESAFNIVPVKGSNFYVYQILIPENKYSNGGKNTEFTLSGKVLLNRFDISVHLASVLNNSSHIVSKLPLSEIQNILNNKDTNISDRITLMQEHERLHLGGIAALSVFGNYILKYEIAYIQGLKYFSRPKEKLNRVDLLLGVDYYGIKDAIISFEIVDKILLQHKKIMASIEQVEKHDFAWGLQIQKNLLKNYLRIYGLFMINGINGKNGGFARISAQYDVIDNLAITLGTNLYLNGANLMYRNISRNNKIITEVRYSF